MYITDSLKFLKENKNSSDQIISFLETENSRKDLEYTNAIARIKLKKQQTLHQFIFLETQEACLNKFSMESERTSLDKEREALKVKLVAKLDQNFAESAEQKNDAANKDIKELVSKNPEFAKMMTAKGNSMEFFQKETPQVSVAAIAKKEEGPPSDNNITKTIESTTSPQSKMMNNHSLAQLNPVVESKIEVAPALETDYLNNKLRSKIAELDKRQITDEEIDKRKDREAESSKKSLTAADKDPESDKADEKAKKRSDEIESLQTEIADIKTDIDKTTALKKPTSIAVDEKTKKPEESSASIFGGNSDKSDNESENKSENQAYVSASLPQSSQTSGNQQVKESTEKTKAALILTSGESSITHNLAILENPKESEIENLIKANDGLPVVILENGVYMEVAMEINADKKRIFIKKVLNKEKMASLAKEININKLAKEVSRVPTRLYNLKTLLKTKVQ